MSLLNEVSETIENEGKVRCRHCGSMHVPVKRGLHNWKNLFRRPSWDDAIILLIMVLVVISFFAYQRDTQICRDTLNNLSSICAQYKIGSIGQKSNVSYPVLNLSLIKVIDSNDTEK